MLWTAIGEQKGPTLVGERDFLHRPPLHMMMSDWVSAFLATGRHGISEKRRSTMAQTARDRDTVLTLWIFFKSQNEVNCEWE